MFEPLSQVHPLLNGLGVGVALQVDAGLGGGDLSGEVAPPQPVQASTAV